MIKKSLLIATLLMTSLNLSADDTYVLSYSKDTNCTLTKNDKTIPFLDPKFGEMNPNYGIPVNLYKKNNIINAK